MKIFLTGTLVLLLISEELISQDLEQISITGTFNNKPFIEWIEEVEGANDLRFFFKEEWVEDVRVTGSFNDQSLNVILGELLDSAGLRYITQSPSYVVLLRNTDDFLSSNEATSASDNQIVKTIGGETRAAKRQVILGGIVRDGVTGEVVVGSNIYIEDLQLGTTSGRDGSYQFEVPPGEYRIRFSNIGMDDTYEVIRINDDGQFDVEMYEKTVELDAVVVTGDAIDANISDNRMGLTKLDIESIKAVPAFLGEIDVIKTIQLLPGVTTVGEGAQGFNVRGGSPADNLILLDGAPVFNASHLFGFFSIFNSDVVRDAALYKGHIPAQYGGRSSSVLDVGLQQGDFKKWSLNGGIGVVTSRLAVNGPIIKDKLSLTASGRSSYSDWILNQVRDLDIRRSSASFFDTNLKLDYQLNENNKLTVSTYLSQDEFRFASDTLYRFSNQVGSFNWSHTFNDKLFSSLLLSYSDYDFDVEGLQEQFRYELQSGISYMGGNFSFSYYPGENHELEAGISGGLYNFRPGKQEALEEITLVEDVELDDERAIETNVYFNDEWIIDEKFSLSYGLRYTWYGNLGPEDLFVYGTEAPLSRQNIIDTVSVSSGEIIQTYQGLEPRVSLRFGIDDKSSVKGSYNRSRQNIHLISNATAITPFDIWRSSGEFLKPQIADQWSLGYFRNFDDNRIETSIEAYYRRLENIPQYKNQADLVLNPALETELINGDGRAYGVEFLVKKEYGRLNGWLSYTYSRTERKADGRFPEEQINSGEYYAADFDRPNDFTTAVNYKISRRWKVSGNFSYTTGRPVSLPVARFSVFGVDVAQFSERNKFRIPDYHRLDLSVTLEGNHRRNKKWEGSWTFTLFNVYSRKNAYSIFFGRDGFPPRLNSFRLSVLGSVFPSLTYNFKFPK